MRSRRSSHLEFIFYSNVAARVLDIPSVRTVVNYQLPHAEEGQSLYKGKDLSKFYPVVLGEDIAALDADEESAR
ncbi:hypothetical protein LR48_Vigan11g064400 [Vigna angularis]|uniref:Uncharacterized protein n=1 Tax=Phaseolus angularis TaxID=3914 RepID=A0A0L9VRB2_PHAAN|nr:hypothetical protein LR48_Vigan11g064400 [Vigna angularis]